MNMLPVRYNSVRKRLIELYEILDHKVYKFWIKPESMMSLDEIRDRSNYLSEGVIADPHYYSTHQLRDMRLPQFMKYLPQMQSYRETGFGNANQTVVEIYESIQEYLQLWCEVMREAPEFRNPPMDELRLLESMALFMFPVYSQVKPYRRSLDAQRYREDGELEAKGLSGFAALFTFYSINGNKEDEEISFISHLDKYHSHVGGEMMMASNMSPSWGHSAGLPSTPNNNYDPTWVFRG